MNTKKQLFIGFLTILFFSPLYVFANDGVSNSALWIHSDNLITCVSVGNIDEVKAHGDLLVFDYSPTAGTQKGKPWTIVEKGKCYEINSLPPAGENQNNIQSGQLFLFEKISAETRNKLENYSAYKSSASISEIFGDKTNATCGQSTDPNYFEYNPDAEACNAMPGAVDIFPYGLGFDIDNLIRYTNVSIEEILNTKYNFNDGVTGGSSSYSDEGRAYVTSPEVSEIRIIHESIATELESVIQKCDIRTREEVRLHFTKGEYGWYEPERTYISRFKDGVDKELSYTLDFKDINASQVQKADYYLQNIGCKADVVAFLESKNDEVSKINKLGDALVAKFADTLSMADGYGGYNPFMGVKSEAEKAELANFYKTTESEDKVVDGSPSIVADADRTELEETTFAEKIRKVSDGGVMKTYWLLPLLGLIIIASILFFRKRK